MKQENTSGSYAVFATGSKQYHAIAGKTVEVDLMDAEVGKTIEIKEVLLRKMVDDAGKEKIEVGAPFLKGSIKASVVKHIRGPKIIVFHFRRRKKSKKKQGHRQPYTVLRIESI